MIYFAIAIALMVAAPRRFLDSKATYDMSVAEPAFLGCPRDRLRMAPRPPSGIPLWPGPVERYQGAAGYEDAGARLLLNRAFGT